MRRLLLSLAYLSCIPFANWLISNAGTVCITDGPCLVPVGFGLMAPSGVAAVGVALCLRDAVQESLGESRPRKVLLVTAAGVLLSALVADPRLALASAVAFGISEGLDAVVFSRVRRLGLPPAVLLSGLLALAVDSVLFLAVAFGSLEHIGGQLLGKFWAVLAASLFAWWRSRALTPHPVL